MARAVNKVCSHLVGRDNEVTVLCVPAHMGIAGNEEADRLAKEAAAGHIQEVSDATGGRPVSYTSPMS